MSKWIVIVAFNIAFGLFAGYMAYLVFGNKEDGWYKGNSAYGMVENRRLILVVAISSVISGMLWSFYFKKGISWQGIGFCFGLSATILSPLLLYTLNQWNALQLQSKSALVLGTKLNVMAELFKTFSLIGAFFMSLMALVYGMLTLLTPLLGLLWGFLMHRFITRIF